MRSRLFRGRLSAGLGSVLLLALPLLPVAVMVSSAGQAAEQADLHLALRPGTDVVLAWALAAELERRGAFDRAFIDQHVTGFEEFMAGARRYSVAEAARICQVEPDAIRQAARLYAGVRPALAASHQRRCQSQSRTHLPRHSRHVRRRLEPAAPLAQVEITATARRRAARSRSRVRNCPRRV